MMKAEWYILRLGNWKVTITSLPDSAALRRKIIKTQLQDHKTTRLQDFSTIRLFD
jgi:hypothetical protein